MPAPVKNFDDFVIVPSSETVDDKDGIIIMPVLCSNGLTLDEEEECIYAEIKKNDINNKSNNKIEAIFTIFIFYIIYLLIEVIAFLLIYLKDILYLLIEFRPYIISSICFVSLLGILCFDIFIERIISIKLNSIALYNDLIIFINNPKEFVLTSIKSKLIYDPIYTLREYFLSFFNH
jgi:hypothetical protein